MDKAHSGTFQRSASRLTCSKARTSRRCLIATLTHLAVPSADETASVRPPADADASAGRSAVAANPASRPDRNFIVPPEQPTPLADIVAALHTITALNGLTESEYTWLATNGTEYVGQDGSLIFVEGGPCDQMHCILKGEIHVRRNSSSPMRLFIGRAGQMTGKLPFSRMKNYGGDGYCVGEAWSLNLHEDRFPAMLEAIPSMAQRSVNVLLDRTREVTRMEQQAEKLAALGKLAGNLAHELNNPASAAQRSAASLFGGLRQYGEQRYQLGRQQISDEKDAALRSWYDRTRQQMSAYSENSTATPTAIAIADREDLLARWLAEHNIPQSWSLAPALAESPLSISQLDALAAIVSPELLALSVPAFASSLSVERMAETVIDSTSRIFDLITAIKDYSYMDLAPIQEVNLADSLDNTLTMFQSRLDDCTVERNYDPSLATLSAYGSELNQVWTALIENAIDAIASRYGSTNDATVAQPSKGILRLKTSLSARFALVEVWDNGTGIAAELQSRVFEPFFTTKAPGRGLGLGLDTAQRIVHKHSGSLTLQSRPGATCFQVRLPLAQAQAY